MYGENAGFNLAHRGWKRDTLRCCELLSVSNVAGKHNLWAEKWRISRNFGEFHVERQSYGGGGFIAVGRLTNSRLVMVTVVYRAGNTRNTVAIMNENLMIHYAHRVERYFVNIEALERREKI